jgi:hypothetical protein
MTMPAELCTSPAAATPITHAQVRWWALLLVIGFSAVISTLIAMVNGSNGSDLLPLLKTVTSKELLEQLPPRRFVQIHRSVIVNLREIERIEHNVLGRPQLHLKKGAGVLSVSRSFAAQFRQM